MRKIAKVDDNQAEIVNALRRVGCSVHLLHQLGGGLPDVLVGRAGANFLLEVKDGNKPPSQRRLTPDEADWHANWRGQKAVVENIQQAFEAVGLKPFKNGGCYGV